MKTGTIVEFKNPFEDERGLTFRVLEERGDRILIQAICDLPYPPSQTVLRADLKEVRWYYAAAN